MISTAKQAAKEAGKILLSYLGKVDRERKSEREFITIADKLAEKEITTIIKGSFPSHSILTEESQFIEEVSDYRWIIDPLDGTNNYVYAYPFFAVSIALEKKGEVILGVVYDPLRDELFEAESGKKAIMNGVEIGVTDISRLKDSRLLTGFPYSMGKNNNLDNFSRLAIDALEIRVDGSAALDLCYVACGRADGYWELKLRPWDTAAGKIIVELAGGHVTQINGDKYNHYIPNLLATNGKIHDEMINILGKSTGSW